MKRRSLLSSLILVVAGVSPTLAAEVPSTATETLAQLERIETEVRAARQEGQTERLAELCEELRKLAVPAAEAVRASRIWASMQNHSTPATARIAGRLDPIDDTKLPGTAWSLDIETAADLDPDDGTKLPGTVWSLENLALDSDEPSQESGDPKSGVWDPESFELAPPQQDHE